MNDLLRNGSGYVDYTAYKAMKNIEKEVNTMEHKRGEIWEYATSNEMEIKKALVVSADFRAKDRYISIIMLLDEAPDNEECIVPITTTGGVMYADCRMVSFARKDRIGNYLRTASEKEMKKIDEKIAMCLGFEHKPFEVHCQNTEIEELRNMVKSQQILLPSADTEELAKAKTEAKIYKDLYEKLLAKVME